MFIGHIGVALAAKRTTPGASLGMLCIATECVDLVWPLLILLGIEKAEIHPGVTAFNPIEFVSYPISHSLLTTAGWGALLGGVYYLVRKDRRSAWIVGLVVLSHWFLDALSHIPDLPLVPWEETRVGLGLWNSIAATLLVEGSLFAAGVILYATATKPIDRTGFWAFWSLMCFLLLVYAANLAGPPPPSMQAVAIAGFSLSLLALWAHWADKHRVRAPGTRNDGHPEITAQP